MSHSAHVRDDEFDIHSTNPDFLLLRTQSAAQSLRQHKQSVKVAREHLIDALRQARNAGVSVTELAKVTGLSRQTLHTFLGSQF